MEPMRVPFALIALAVAIGAIYLGTNRQGQEEVPPARATQRDTPRPEFRDRTTALSPATVKAPENALAAAWKSAQERPEDPAAWENLGEEQADRNQLEAAKQSFRTAIRLGSVAGRAHARLGFILYAQELDAVALELLMEARARGAEVPLLTRTIEALQRKLATAAPAPPSSDEAEEARDSPPDVAEPSQAPAEESLETAYLPDNESAEMPCELPLERQLGNGAYLVTAEFGGVDARLILDTGATRTVLTEAFAYGADIEPDQGAMIRAVTANGAVLQPTAVIEELVVAGRVITDLRVVICETCRELPTDGLLGLDVQNSLEMQLDLVGERVRFGDCTE
jgi:hypothetical protein